MNPTLFSTIRNSTYLHTWRYCRWFAEPYQGRHFNFFLGTKFFFKFFNATGLLKNRKKQHFICSNLTLFIVPFFLFSLFFSFLSVFSFFLSFFSFFLSFFSFFLFPCGGGGRRLPQPSPNDASEPYIENRVGSQLIIYTMVHNYY